MPGIDQALTFHPLGIAVMTISDTRDQESDRSGALLAERVTRAGHRLEGREIAIDDVAAIQALARRWIADPAIDIIITTGGTGFMPRDVTPEAIKPLLGREMDGFAAVFHQVSHSTIGVSTLQSRAFGGQAGTTFIFCLPGSPGACRDGWDQILAFELDSRFRPCSIAGLLPRLAHAVD